MTELTDIEFFNLFFLEKNLSLKKYIFGINENTNQILKHTKVDGVIDDYSTLNYYHDIPIVSLEQIDANSLVVSAVTNSRPKTALKKIAQSRAKYFIDYYSLVNVSDGLLRHDALISSSMIAYKNFKEQFEWVKGIFNDKISAEIYEKLLAFRVSGQLDYMQDFDFRVQEQYFETFFELQDGEVFVDGGGFDGATSLEFIRQCPMYKKIYFFEPVQTTMDLAKEKLLQYKNIDYLAYGLYSTSETLRFNSALGSASHLSEEGDVEIHTAALDSIVTDSVSFIKLDIEGTELQALEGMRNHIMQDHPKLAIAVYHKFEDFFLVPKYILGLRTDYNIYLRHYTESCTESIMYFIPK